MSENNNSKKNDTRARERRLLKLPAAGRLLPLLVIAVLIISQTACGSKSEPVEKQVFCLDTTCTISVYDMDGGLDKDKAESAIDRTFDRCRELDKMLSNTVETSDISRINGAGGEWVEVSDETREVIEAGIRWGEASGGDFDITVGTLTDIWDYHAEDPVVPSDEAVSEAVSHVDYRNIETDGSRVRLTDPAAKIDLGGIGKGYIAGELEKTLKDQGVTAAVINLGGNIVAFGVKPGGDSYIIGIEKPYSGRSELIGSTETTDATLVTSGVYERQFEVDGKVYHHIIDPSTGYPAETDLDSITILADDDMAADADALSTICLLLGSEKGLSFIENMDGVEAVFCTSDGEIKATPGFDFEQK
jgi:thiamine biosynthesis lipoprotein